MTSDYGPQCANKFSFKKIKTTHSSFWPVIYHIIKFENGPIYGEKVNGLLYFYNESINQILVGPIVDLKLFPKYLASQY